MYTYNYEERKLYSGVFIFILLYNWEGVESSHMTQLDLNSTQWLLTSLRLEQYDFNAIKLFICALLSL